MTKPNQYYCGFCQKDRIRLAVENRYELQPRPCDKCMIPILVSAFTSDLGTKEES